MTSKGTEYVFKPFKVIKVVPRGTRSPRPRSGHRIACDDTNIYCFGGFNPGSPSDPASYIWSHDRPLFRDLWSYSIANRTWKQHKIIGHMPEELASCAMCMNGKRLMIYGGTGAPFGTKCSNDVTTWQVYEGGTRDAHLKVLPAQGQRPPGQYGQAVLCHKGHFYTIGGTNGFDYNCDIHRLDLKSLEWEPVFIGTGREGEPIGRYRHELAKLGDKLYIIGGGTGGSAFELMNIPVFDLEKQTWTIENAKGDDSFNNSILCGPMPRKCHSAVQINTSKGAQVFVVGGTDGQLVFQDVWRLELPELQWTLMRKTVLPRSLHFHSATVTTYGCMYIFGGIENDIPNGYRVNTIYKVWLCIPKLSEISWEALLSVNPSLGKKCRNSLLNSGIPLQYVDRLKPR